VKIAVLLRSVRRCNGQFQTFQTFNRFAPFQSFKSFEELKARKKQFERFGNSRNTRLSLPALGFRGPCTASLSRQVGRTRGGNLVKLTGANLPRKMKNTSL